MNRDDIIRMAREAGWNIPANFNACNEGFIAHLERFAALAAAAERDACAQVCDDAAASWCSANYCADAIRARGQS